MHLRIGMGDSISRIITKTSDVYKFKSPEYPRIFHVTICLISSKRHGILGKFRTRNTVQDKVVFYSLHHWCSYRLCYPFSAGTIFFNSLRLILNPVVGYFGTE